MKDNCPKCGNTAVRLNIEDTSINIMQQNILSPPIICSKCEYKHYDYNRISVEEWYKKRDNIIDDLLED